MMISAVTVQWSMLVTSWLTNAADGKSDPGKVKLGVKKYVSSLHLLSATWKL